MKTGNFKLIGLLALMVAFVLALTGCDGLQDTPDIDPDAHGVKITVNIPDGLVDAAEEVGILRIEDFVDIKKVKVTLENDEVEDIVKEKEVSQIDFKDEYVIIVEDVKAQFSYDVTVDLKGTIRNEEEVKTLYSGDEKTGVIEPDSLVELTIGVDPLDALGVHVTLKEDEGEDGILEKLESVTLRHPQTEDYFDNNNSFSHDYTVEFNEELKPSRWHLVLKFFDGDRLDAIEFLLLPTEIKDITLTFKWERGEIKVISDVHESPDTPENLRVEDENLVWDEVNDAEYVVLKSQTKEGELEPVTLETIPDNKFSLADLDPGYYYWVRAYVDGYSSGVSEEPYRLPPEGEAFNSRTLKFYDSIQDALEDEDLETGDTIYVGPGIYEGDKKIEVDGITLKGPNAGIPGDRDRGEEAEIHGRFKVHANNVKIDGFKVVNDDLSGTGSCVDQNMDKGLELYNNILTESFRGIRLGDMYGPLTEVKIIGNKFKTEHGVTQTENTTHLLIMDNVFDTPDEGIGLGEGVQIVNENREVVPFYEDIIWLEENNEFNQAGVKDYRPPIKNTDSGEFFDSIQNAIDAAGSGDTIVIADGTYEDETLNIIEDGITLKGLGNPEVVLTGDSSITIYANNVTVAWLKFDDTSSTYTITVEDNADEAKILNNTFTNRGSVVERDLRVLDANGTYVKGNLFDGDDNQIGGPWFNGTKGDITLINNTVIKAWGEGIVINQGDVAPNQNILMEGNNITIDPENPDFAKIVVRNMPHSINGENDPFEMKEALIDANPDAADVELNFLASVDTAQALFDALDCDRVMAIQLIGDIEYTAPNEDANFVIPQDNLVLDGKGFSLKYEEIGGGRSVIEATGDGVIVRNLTLKNQSPDKQPSDLNARGKNVLFKYNEIRRGTEQGNPAIIIGPDATGSIVRDNTIDYGAIAADTHECTIVDNTMDWVISEGIWMHPTPYTEQEAKDRANTLASDNNIRAYNADGPVKVLDKDGNWHFAD